MLMRRSLLAMSAMALALAASAPAAAAEPAKAWTDRALSADQRADLLVKAMTQDEKLVLVTGYFGSQEKWNRNRFDEARLQSAGYVPGVPRLGFTPQWQTDAGSGVATQGKAVPALERTALPSGILTASTWNPALAERSGAMIGAEARASGFNVMLAGGMNLLRDPGNGRNFEYGGEDPLLSGTMTGALVRGIQSNRIVATLKHYAFNNQETGRTTVNVLIDEAPARMSDLLAFQIALEQSGAHSIMCSYNLVNGPWACQSDWLLTKVLKRDWGFKGYVMSDWGAQHDTIKDANAGLDQETGVGMSDAYVWRDKLKAALATGKISQARLDDMARRVARSLIASGAVDDPVAIAPIDFKAHAAVSQADAEEGIVLLRNEGGVLPLAATARTIAVVGGHADVGVLTGGGSAQVYSPGGNAVEGLGPKEWPGPVVYAKSSPLAALKAERPGAQISFHDGADTAAAAAAAAKADVAIVFVTQWTAESLDFPLGLPDGQDALVEAVARANPHTVVVLETGGPVLMPWIDRVAAAVQAWYPGTRGGEAIARVLTGAVNPSGHLPATFPRSADQMPRPVIPGDDVAKDKVFDVRFSEGAAVGYRWFDQRKLEPLFPFGHGLSYTTFAMDGLKADAGSGELKVSFKVTNTGKTAGAEVAQVYVSPEAAGWEAPKRLGAFAKVALAPGAAATSTVTVDPRLLAVFDTTANAWRQAPGRYRITLAASARDPGESVVVTLPERTLPAGRGVTP
jgi:beta-glucosidase